MEKKEVVLLFLIVFGSIGVVWNISTVYNDLAVLKELTYMEKLFLANNPKFEYVKGFWLVFSGLFFIFLLVFLDSPSFKNVFKTFKRDLTKKLGHK